MLGLLLIYFIGKSFYNLAEGYKKSAWGFAILGIISYYAGTMLAGLCFGILSELGVTDFFIELPELALGFVALPFGVAACWGFYKILENQWSKQPTSKDDQTLDGDFINPRR